MAKNTDWVAVKEVGNYFRMYKGHLQACPMMADGSRGSDDEVRDVDKDGVEDWQYQIACKAVADLPDADQHVDPVDGQCGTCRWGKIDFGPSPSGPEDGVLCSCEAHIKLLCEQQGNDYDLEEFKTYGAVNYFRLEALADEKDICPNWRPRPGEVKDQWIPLPNAANETTCPWCGRTYPVDDEAMTSVEAGYIDIVGPYALHVGLSVGDCGHYVRFRSWADETEELDDHKTEEEYLNAAIESADQAFWAQIAADYPQVKTGDFAPEQHIAWHEAIETAVRAWLSANW